MQWRENDTISNGIRLHFREGGRLDGPAVALSHGVTDSGACWPKLAPILAER